MANKPETTARVGRLHTLGSVAHELGRLYRAARRGDVPVGDAYRLSCILTQLRQALEPAQIEDRLSALEDALEERRHATKPNGQHAASARIS